MEKRKSRLVIYDFDGTIFKSPDRKAGEDISLQLTGKKLPFPGWWGRKESLLPPIVPEKPGKEWYIEHSIAAYREDIKDDDTEVILMTGRIFKNRKRVIEICQNADILFHDHYFSGQPGHKGKNTLEIKSNFILNDLMHENLKILEIWEDRPEHVEGFLNLTKKMHREILHLQKTIILDVTT